MTNPAVWLVSYLKESKQELEKVSWPTRGETIRYSVVVIIACVAMGAFFAGLDWVLNLGLEQLIAVSA